MKTHAIRWKSTVNGRAGTGTRLFDQEQAERLAIELNEQYPEIEHEAVIHSPMPAEPEAREPTSSAGQSRDSDSNK